MKDYTNKCYQKWVYHKINVYFSLNFLENNDPLDINTIFNELGKITVYLSIRLRSLKRIAKIEVS